MATLRLALAQVDPTVGDLGANSALVRGWTRKAAESGSDLVAFPEMTLTGYPVEDLVFRESFVAASKAALQLLATGLAEDGLGGTAVIVGISTPMVRRGSPPRQRGPGPRTPSPSCTAAGWSPPTSNTTCLTTAFFDEDRYFVPGDTLQVIRVAGVDVALTICEDMWQAGGPFTAAACAGVGLGRQHQRLPVRLDKDDVRLALVRRRAADARACVAYVNMVGGQDELVFDGDSMVVTAGGELLARAAQFAEELLILDLDLPAASATALPPALPPAQRGEMAIRRTVVSSEPAPHPGTTISGTVAPRLSDEAEVWQALVLGLRDYVRKNGFRSVVIALSGGIDSSVVAAIAVDAVGPTQVYGISMPSGHSSEHSKRGRRRPGSPYRPALPGPSRSSRWWTPSCPTSRSRVWRWRTSRRGCVA